MSDSLDYGQCMRCGKVLDEGLTVHACCVVAKRLSGPELAHAVRECGCGNYAIRVAARKRVYGHVEAIERELKDAADG